MTRPSSTALAVPFALLLAAVPVVAKAEPRVLAGSELEMVTAGFLLPSIQINVNAVGQAAVATSVAIAVCAACENPTVQAVAPATAFNINIADLMNFGR